MDASADGLRIDTLMPAQRSLRVAVVSETYPPEVNGVAATIAQVVEGLRQRGHELQLVRPRQGQGDAPAEESRFVEVLLRGLPIPRYPQLKMGLPSRRALLRLWTLRRPDVVHLVTEGPLGWSALHAAQRLKLPLVADFRTNFHAYSRHYGLNWLERPIMGYLRKFHNRVACTMVPTEALRAELARQGFQRLRVVARGVDTRLFHPSRRDAALRRAWGVGDDALVVLYVGRLAPEKNLETLIEGFEALKAVDARARLVLVGDGPAAAALRERCPWAVFAGVRRGTELAAHYASADAFFFPSMTETFGNVVPEAMASGLAVLAYEHAAAGQLIRHGANGLLVPLADRARWVESAWRLAGDLDRVRALGRAARASVESLGWEQIVALVEAEYVAAMAGAPEPIRAPVGVAASAV